jgi:hypothetical protein
MMAKASFVIDGYCYQSIQNSVSPLLLNLVYRKEFYLILINSLANHKISPYFKGASNGVFI